MLNCQAPNSQLSGRCKNKNLVASENLGYKFTNGYRVVQLGHAHSPNLKVYPGMNHWPQHIQMLYSKEKLLQQLSQTIMGIPADGLEPFGV